MEKLKQTVFDTTLKVYLVGSTVFFWPGMLAYAPQEMFIQYFAFVFLALSFWISPKRKLSNGYLALFLIYALAQTLFLHFTEVSRMALCNLFLALVTLKILAERIDFDFKKIGNLFALLVVANIFLLSLQILDIDPLFTNLHFDKRPQICQVGFMGAEFALGCLAALVTPFLFAANPFSCIALLPLLFFGKASTAVGAAVICFMFMLWHKDRLWFWSIIPILVIVGSYYIFGYDMPTGQFGRRIHVWWAGINQMRSSPYFGLGLGTWNTTNFMTVQLNGEPEKWMWAHNEFVQYLYECGIVGCLFLYAYFKNFVNKFVFDKTGVTIFAAFISLMIISFFHFPYHIGRFAGIAIYIFALMEAHTSEVRDEKLAVAA